MPRVDRALAIDAHGLVRCAQIVPMRAAASLVRRLATRRVTTRARCANSHTQKVPGSPAQGVEHEIDGAADGWCGAVIVECKATEGGISKADAALFHVKVMDFYLRRIATASRAKWWPILCGTTTTAPAARVTATNLGLLICDPGRLPLPVLMRAASRPSADLHLPGPLLQEIVWLGERALRPQQERWPYRAQAREISFQPDLWEDSEIKDLMWLEDELSSNLLDLYEAHRPGVLVRRAGNLLLRARKVA